ncbi:protein disulfide oxidoreductase [soil metagenome]
MITSRSRLLGIFFATTFVLAACGGDPDASDTGATADGSTPAAAGGPPAFSAPTLAGGEVDTASFEGRPTVLWFWAPWCTICRAEASGVVETAGELAEEVDLYGVAGRGEVDAMEQFVDQTGTDGLTHVIDDDGSIWSDYEVAAQPAFAFIDADGEVEVFVGTLGREGLRERMQDLIAS